MPKTPGKPPFSVVPLETTAIAPPRKLGPSGLELWDAVQREYRIGDRGGVEILMQICLAQDRVEALREAIDRDGETVYMRGSPRTHPALRDELQLRAFICRGLQRLGLNVEPIKPPGRPASGFGWTGPA
jgi:hypothetical protein